MIVGVHVSIEFSIPIYNLAWKKFQAYGSQKIPYMVMIKMFRSIYCTICHTAEQNQTLTCKCCVIEHTYDKWSYISVVTKRGLHSFMNTTMWCEILCRTGFILLYKINYKSQSFMGNASLSLSLVRTPMWVGGQN